MTPTHPAATRPAVTRPGRWWGPRTGRVARAGKRGAGLSTGPWAGWVVAGGGVVFLLLRTSLTGLPWVVPVLGVGYLVMLGAAVAVGVARPTAGPLGWAVPLGVGVVGVVAAGVVGGPVGDRRVGVVGGGLAVLAGVAEEALFRRLGAVAAVVGGALGFALVHLPAYGVAAMPVDLGAALLLSWQRYASGRWTVPAVTHAIANLLAVT
jgi:hypothetical protein